MVPVEGLPPIVPLTSQLIFEFVPPETTAMKFAEVVTFTESVAGEIVTLIPVAGSVQVEVEVVVEEDDEVVEQVMAVLVDDEW